MTRTKKNEKLKKVLNQKPAFPKPGPPVKKDLKNRPKNTGRKPIKDKDHLNWVASQGCMIPGCSNPPCVHHIRILGEQRDDKKTIPLCWNHHQGSEGIHFMGKHVWREKYGHELDMLDELMKRKRFKQQ